MYIYYYVCPLINAISRHYFDNFSIIVRFHNMTHSSLNIFLINENPLYSVNNNKSSFAIKNNVFLFKTNQRENAFQLFQFKNIYIQNILRFCKLSHHVLETFMFHLICSHPPIKSNSDPICKLGLKVNDSFVLIYEPSSRKKMT